MAKRANHADFDGYIVPTVPARKQQQDTAATLAELARMGVPANRVRLVFNQMERDDAIEVVFDTLLAYCKASGTVTPRLDACLGVNEIYGRVRLTDTSLQDWAADATDYKAEIAKAATQADKLALAQMLATQRLARGVIPTLDACFAALDLHSLTS